jgi:hypothetical protein
MGVQNYKPGTEVPLTFILADDVGNILAPTSLSWRILDEAETVLQDWAVVALPYGETLDLVIPSGLTTVVLPALRGVRTVELEVTTSTGTIELSQSVMLQGATALAFGINTFQTYAQALLLSGDFPDLQTPGWSGAGRESREKAMIEAYRRILLLPIALRVDDSQSLLNAGAQFGPTPLRYMTPPQMMSLYPPMLEDLRLAQVIEAEFILNMDPITQARTDGLSSMTTGESSQTFRAGNPLNFPVCPKALAQLQRWVRFGARIGRS